MQTRHAHQGLTWIDLENPTRDEVAQIASEFSIDEMTAGELLTPSVRARADVFPSYMFLVMHFPALRHSHRDPQQEIDFIIGRDFLITSRYDTVDPLHKFSKVFEVNALLGKEDIGAHAGYLFYYMLKKLYRSVEHEVEHLKQELGTIEHRIFAGGEIQMVSAISKAARDLLNLRQTIEPHRDTLASLETPAQRFFGNEFAPYIHSLQNEYYRVHNHIMRSTDFLHELRETNNSLLTTKQNETIRILTVITAITLPLSLITNIFEINTVYTPIIGMRNDFWIIMGMMVAATVAMYSYFRRKKWL